MDGWIVLVSALLVLLVLDVLFSDLLSFIPLLTFSLPLSLSLSLSLSLCFSFSFPFSLSVFLFLSLSFSLSFFFFFSSLFLSLADAPVDSFPQNQCSICVSSFPSDSIDSRDSYFIYLSPLKSLFSTGEEADLSCFLLYFN